MRSLLIHAILYLLYYGSAAVYEIREATEHPAHNAHIAHAGKIKLNKIQFNSIKAPFSECSYGYFIGLHEIKASGNLHI